MTLKSERLWLLVVSASGAAALTYQVVWQRWLALTVGGTSTSAAVVVAAFLAGLGAGALLGGHLADRVSPRRGLVVFVLLEAGIALFGLSSAWLLHDWLPTVAVLGSGRPLITFATIFLVLLPATILMGMTMPVLVTLVRRETPLAQAGFIGRLVGVNTIGAAAGAAATILVLVPLWGYDGAVWCAAALNLLCALAAWRTRLRQRSGGQAADRGPAYADATAGKLRTAVPLPWLVHAAVAGAAGIAYELVAYRVLDYAVKGRAQTFALLLSAYLLGFGAGSWAGDRWKSRQERGRWQMFLGGQVLLYVSMAALPAVVLHLMPAVPAWFESLASYRPVQGPTVMALNYGLLPLLLLTVPAALMGLGFSLAQQLIQTDHAGVGRRLGWMTGANAAGCVVGAVATTYWWLPTIGTAGTLRMLAALGIGYAAMFAIRLRAPVAAVGAAVVVAAAVWLLPASRAFWTTLSGSHDASQVVVQEESNGVANLRYSRDGRTAEMFAGGVGQSALPRPEDLHHIVIGALPVLLHDAPTRVGVVGLGAGGTLWGAASRPEVQTLVCWELLGGQRALLQEYATRTGDLEVTFFERDPRIQVVVGDGRHALATSAATFDVIAVDAVLPDAGGAGRMYSREFFALLRSRLAPGGIAVTWAPTARTLHTLRAAFPHVTQIGDLLAVGSEAPLTSGWRDVEARLTDAAVAEYFGPLLDDLIDMMREPLTDGRRDVPGSPGTDINTDMRPRDELAGLTTLVNRYLSRRQ